MEHEINKKDVQSSEIQNTYKAADLRLYRDLDGYDIQSGQDFYHDLSSGYVDSDYKTEMLQNAIRQGSLGIIKILQAHDVQATSNKFPIPPLVLACVNDQTDIAEYLIKQKANPNERYKTNHTSKSLLEIACNKGDLSMVKLLVENKANVNCEDNLKNNAPLNIASNKKHYNIIKYLINNGAKVDLPYAIEHGKFPVLKACIDNNYKQFEDPKLWSAIDYNGGVFNMASTALFMGLNEVNIPFESIPSEFTNELTNFSSKDRRKTINVLKNYCLNTQESIGAKSLGPNSGWIDVFKLLINQDAEHAKLDIVIKSIYHDENEQADIISQLKEYNPGYFSSVVQKSSRNDVRYKDVEKNDQKKSVETKHEKLEKAEDVLPQIHQISLDNETSSDHDHDGMLYADE